MGLFSIITRDYYNRFKRIVFPRGEMDQTSKDANNILSVLGSRCLCFGLTLAKMLQCAAYYDTDTIPPGVTDTK